MERRRKFRYVTVICLALVCAVYLVFYKTDAPRDITRTFLANYYGMNFKKLYKIVTPETLERIKDIESRVGEMPDKNSIRIPDIEVFECYEEGDTARCRYILRQDKEDTNAMSEYLTLIKKENKWLVDY